MGRKNAVIAVALLALGLAGVALAGVATGLDAQRRARSSRSPCSTASVTFTTTTLPAGKVTLVVVEQGHDEARARDHGRDDVRRSGRRRSPPARPRASTVTLAAGKYHMWDPVTSSMSHAKFITVKAPATRSTTGERLAAAGSGSTGELRARGSSGGGPAAAADDGSRHGRLRPHVTEPCRRPAAPGGRSSAGRCSSTSIGIAHPSHLVVGESDRLFLAIHLAFPFVICLLAWALFLLVDGVDERRGHGRARARDPVRRRLHRVRVGRGIARGAFVWKAEGLPGDRQQNAARADPERHAQRDRAAALADGQRASGSQPRSSVVVALRGRRRCPRSCCSLSARCCSRGATCARGARPGMAAFLAGVGLGRAARG